jgi:hypothetical protein
VRVKGLRGRGEGGGGDRFKVRVRKFRGMRMRG